MATRLSTVIAATPETDLAVVQEMAAQLESYILGGEVYRTLALPTPVHGEERVQSSGGDLLARLHKLSAQPNFLPPCAKGGACGGQSEGRGDNDPSASAIPGPAAAGGQGAPEQLEMVS